MNSKIKLICFWIGVIFVGRNLSAVAAQVPEKEYVKDEGTLFLCHFNNVEEVRALGGEIANTVAFVPGKYGNGILCAREGDYVAFPSHGAISFKEGTLEMWVKPEMDMKDVTTHLFLFMIYKSDKDHALYIYYNSVNQTICMFLSKNEDGKIISCYPQASVKEWKKGEWHHLAFTWGKGAFIYFDGEMVASVKYEGKETPLPANKFFVGSTPWKSNQARMVIDELRILPVQIFFERKAETW